MQRSFGREIASVILRVFAVVLTVILIIVSIGTWYSYDGISDGWCNVAIFPIEGVIVPYKAYDQFPLIVTPNAIRDFITQSENDSYIQAIMFEINSPGGTPVASEQISEAIKTSTLPTLSLIGDIGTSGGYLAASAADRVIASPMSDVGSIGVTMSYTEESKKNEEEGVTFVQLSTGEFKDAGNPNKPLTEAERTLFEKDLQLIHDQFVKEVAENRGKEIWEIQALADGSAVTGGEALDKGLVDRLGGREVAREELANMLNLNINEVTFCEYQGSLLPF
ncbi:MAG: signal peptide peptidase SppA [Candidatus Paceibacterota bacterium]